MAEDTDLLPWLLGGMLTLGAVAATAVVLADSSAGNAPNAAVTAAPARPAPISPSTASAAPPLQADLSPVVVSPNARSQLPPGQVWECVIDGQRVFSDTRCGAHASVRQLTDLNVMDSREAYPPGAYAQGAPQPYSPGPAPGYYPAPSSDAGTDESEAGYPVYTGSPVVVVRERARRDRDHNPHRPSRPRPRAARP